jgi:hypothetical protein
MKFTLTRIAWIFVILGVGFYAQSISVAQEIEACCRCGDPQFDSDCNFVCPDSPFCECGYPYCSEDGSGWVCAGAPYCEPGYEPACVNGAWTCAYAGGNGGIGGYDSYFYCPFFDPYCAYCPYWDPYCEYCDYEWDSFCYDCDSCDPSCYSYYTNYWACPPR